MHFEIDSYEPTKSAIGKNQTDRHALKSESPYEKTNWPALLALLRDNWIPISECYNLRKIGPRLHLPLKK